MRVWINLARQIQSIREMQPRPLSLPPQAEISRRISLPSSIQARSPQLSIVFTCASTSLNAKLIWCELSGQERPSDEDQPLIAAYQHTPRQRESIALHGG